MVGLTKTQTEELNCAILEYLKQNKYEIAAEAF